MNGDKRVTLICTESADKEFEREMLALLGDSEYRRYTYKYEHPTARSADSRATSRRCWRIRTTTFSSSSPTTRWTSTAFSRLWPRPIRALRAAAARRPLRGAGQHPLEPLQHRRPRDVLQEPRDLLLDLPRQTRLGDRAAFDDAYIRSFGALPTLFSYRGYDTAMIFAPAMYGDIEYDLEDRRYTPLQTTYRFGQNEGRENHVNRNWTRVNYNSDFTITIE